MVEKKSRIGFAGGAFVLMLFGLLSKIVGAVYRIPLTGIVGAEGVGLYQMVFPLYTLMLTISSSGLPSSISKLISQNLAKNNYKQASKILKVSLILLVSFSFLCSLFVFIFAKYIAEMQGNVNVTVCYYGLAPAILFVGLISGFRGYFQGKQKMFPSAFSGFIEQVVKMVFGLLFASKWIYKGVEWGVLGAVLGITLSEVVAFIYLFLCYIFRRKEKIIGEQSLQVDSFSKTARSILSLSVFVTLGGLIMPLTMLVDSCLVINILQKIGVSTQNATKMFGLQTGTVGSIINMPVVLSLAISTAILPSISYSLEKGNVCEAKKSATKAIFLTILFALPCAIGCSLFAEPIIKLLYGRGLSLSEIKLASGLLEIAGVGVLYLALVQVCSGILQGMNKFIVPVISLSVGGVVKIILNVLLVRIPSVNIFGAEVSSVMCYLVALIINLFVLRKFNVIQLDWKILLVALFSLIIIPARFLFEYVVNLGLNYYLALIMVVISVVILYFFFSICIIKKIF